MTHLGQNVPFSTLFNHGPSRLKLIRAHCNLYAALFALNVRIYLFWCHLLRLNGVWFKGQFPDCPKWVLLWSPCWLVACRIQKRQCGGMAPLKSTTRPAGLTWDYVKCGYFNSTSMFRGWRAGNLSFLHNFLEEKDLQTTKIKESPSRSDNSICAKSTLTQTLAHTVKRGLLSRPRRVDFSNYCI